MLKSFQNKAISYMSLMNKWQRTYVILVQDDEFHLSLYTVNKHTSVEIEQHAPISDIAISPEKIVSR